MERDVARQYPQRQFLGVDTAELVDAACAFLAFFCLLGSYYMVRPVRDEAGAALGPKGLPLAFVLVLVASLAAVPTFGKVMNSIRTSFVPTAVFAFFIATGAALSGAFVFARHSMTLSLVFYVWVSVFVMFAVSIFWSLMTDVWSEDQSKRFFPIIAAGGTLGALAGPFVVRATLPTIGIGGIVGAAMIGLSLAAALCLKFQRKLAKRQGDAIKLGDIWAGARAVLTQPFLRSIAIGVFFSNAIMALLYMEQARLVGSNIADASDRVIYFSQIETLVSVGTIFVELVIARALLRSLGPGLTVALIGLVAIVGLVALHFHSTLFALACVMVMQRVATYGLWNPTMRVLYTTVTPEQKYKAQNFNDTVIYNGSAAFSSNLLGAISQQIAIAPGSLILGVPMALGWVATGLVLRRRRQTEN